MLHSPKATAHFWSTAKALKNGGMFFDTSHHYNESWVNHDDITMFNAISRVCSKG